MHDPEQKTPATPVMTPSTPKKVDQPSRPSRGESLRAIASTVAILLVAPLIAILLTSFVFQSYQVDGPSMQSTLHNNDRLIVWKFPHTWSRITGHQYVPNRGDIVIFTDERLSDLGQDPTKQLIKRVVGLPGERVVVANGVVTVYNTAHPHGFHPDTDLPYHRTGTDTAGNLDWTIPSGQIFVLGDNRTNSSDSRAFGTVKLNNVVGKLVLRILPFGQMERF